MRGDAFIHFVSGSRRVNIRLGVLLLIPKSPHIYVYIYVYIYTYIYIYIYILYIYILIYAYIFIYVHFGSISSLIQISLNIIDIFCLHIFFWIRSYSCVAFILFGGN